MIESEFKVPMPLVKVVVVEPGQRVPRGATGCVIGRHLDFSTRHLESYCLSSWKPLLFDALLVAAAVEFCDRIQKRPRLGWGRHIRLRIPVHDLGHWSQSTVQNRLMDALCLLTGDDWHISFVQRRKSEEPPPQGLLEMPQDITAVIPFSDGLDSKIVGALSERERPKQVIRVRLGTKVRRKGQPFTSVPYDVNTGHSGGETSMRSRGFKFATVSAVAAYMVGASEVIMPESGQGALGSVLVPVVHGYGDYRNHPLFAERMELYLSALFGQAIRFVFPRLWFTKGETLRTYMQGGDDEKCLETRSCWQQSRHASADNRRRQCGICAACMLRRLSIHAAQLHENPDKYIWCKLSAPTLEAGAATQFDKITKAMQQYAIAGTLHLDHLAALRRSPLHAASLRRHAAHLGRTQKLETPEAEKRLNRLLDQHRREWSAFVNALGSRSFVAQWVGLAA